MFTKLNTLHTVYLPDLLQAIIVTGFLSPSWALSNCNETENITVSPDNMNFINPPRVPVSYNCCKCAAFKDYIDAIPYWVIKDSDHNVVAEEHTASWDIHISNDGQICSHLDISSNVSMILQCLLQRNDVTFCTSEWTMNTSTAGKYERTYNFCHTYIH